MPQIGILFSGGLGSTDPLVVSGEALATLGGACPRGLLAGCWIGHGRSAAGHYCLVVEHVDEATVAGVERCIEASTDGMLLPVESRFLREPKAKLATYTLDYRLGQYGEPVEARSEGILHLWPALAGGAPTGEDMHSSDTAGNGPYAASQAPAQQPPVTSPAALKLPREAPKALRAAEQFQQRRCAVLGILAGVGLALVLGIVVPGGPVREMFDWRHPSSAVPAGILCMFFWGLLLCRVRRARLSATEKLVLPELTQQVVGVLETHGPAAAAALLNAPAAAHSPLLRRIRVALEQWNLRPSLTNASLALDQQAAADAEGVHRGYGLIRLFVWAAPVLGLIGTVVGISLAVGGFARFLAGNIDDIAIIKTNLVNVTSGLSFAFLITLEGLLASLILMLLASGLQNRESRMYALVEKAVAERFLPALQAASPERDGTPPAPFSLDFNALAAVVARSVAESVGVHTRSVIEEMGQQGQCAAQSLREIAEKFEGAARALTAEVSAAVASAAEKTANTNGEFSAEVSALRETIVAGARLLGESGDAHSSALHTHSSSLGEALAGHAQAIGAAAELGRDILASSTGIAELFRHLHETTDGKLARALEEAGRGMREQGTDLRTAAGAVAEFARLTGQSIEAQTALQGAMTQLHEAGLDKALVSVAASLRSLEPVLAGFREPFVLQAVPAIRR